MVGDFLEGSKIASQPMLFVVGVSMRFYFGAETGEKKVLAGHRLPPSHPIGRSLCSSSHYGEVPNYFD